MKKEEFVEMALSYVGSASIKYRHQGIGSSIDGFDCSGFMYFLLHHINFPDNVPRHANEQFDQLGVLIHWEFRDAGDLIFFSRNGKFPAHVGLMISRDAYVHAPGKDGTSVCVQKLERESIGANDMSEGEKLQIYFSNPIGFKRLTVHNGRYQKYFFAT